jgi:hypothetical protein
VDVVVDSGRGLDAADLVAHRHRRHAGGRQRMESHAGHPRPVRDLDQAELVHQHVEPVVGPRPQADNEPVAPAAGHAKSGRDRLRPGIVILHQHLVEQAEGQPRRDQRHSVRALAGTSTGGP